MYFHLLVPRKPASPDEFAAALNDHEKSRCREAAAAVVTAFNWGASPEGAEFWADIHNRLITYAGGKEH